MRLTGQLHFTPEQLEELLERMRTDLDLAEEVLTVLQANRAVLLNNERRFVGSVSRSFRAKIESGFVEDPLSVKQLRWLATLYVRVACNAADALERLEE